jgi:hypothetical protein
VWPAAESLRRMPLVFRPDPRSFLYGLPSGVQPRLHDPVDQAGRQRYQRREQP